MAKQIRSAYEIASERVPYGTGDRTSIDESRPQGFFVEDRPTERLVPKPPPIPGKRVEAQKNTTTKGEKMNIHANCEFTISNKLARAIAEGSSISISIDGISGNKGVGHLKAELNGRATMEDFVGMGDTSVMLNVKECLEDIPTLSSEIAPVQSFGKVGFVKGTITDPKEKVEKMRKLNLKQSPSEAEKEAAVAAVKKRQSQRPVAHDRGPVAYGELIAACRMVPNVDDTKIPVPKPKNGIRLTRSEAIEYEKELLALPRVPAGIYLKNNTGSNIEVGDMTINGVSLMLSPHEVFNLSKLPAKMAMGSIALKSLLSSPSGYLSLAGEDEYQDWLENGSRSETGHWNKLEAFSGENAVEKAQSQIFDSGVDEQEPKIEIAGEGMEITGEEADNPAVYDSEETMQVIRDLPKEHPEGYRPVSAPAKQIPAEKKSIRRV